MKNDDIRAAVRSLRDELKLSQTDFGRVIGKGLATIQRYENLVPPRGEVLVQLMKLADANNRLDLSEIFRGAIGEQLGHDVPRFAASGLPELLPGEADEIAILLTVLRSPGYKALRNKWVHITTPVRDSHSRGDANALALAGLFAEVKRRRSAGDPTEIIVQSLDRWNPETVRGIVATLDGNDKLTETGLQ